jgi:hypothetical protein
MSLEPCLKLERTIRVIHSVFGGARINYWLGFGGLLGITKYDGIIPDDDFDICVMYGTDYRRIERSFYRFGFKMVRAMQNDMDPSNVVYAGFNPLDREKFAHVCVSFWYLHDGIRYYCHDQAHEVVGTMVPPSGYFFKGVPDHVVNDERLFRLVEWPGIPQRAKIRVPRFPGEMLDCTYRDWAYQKQKYTVGKKFEFKPEMAAPYNKSSAKSRYRVHVKSMAQWNDTKYIQQQLKLSEAQWWTDLKLTKA